jgi:hypothetical protein
MRDLNIESVLRAISKDAPGARRQHRLRTPDCPPLTRFPEGTRNGWSAEVAEHVGQCAYCQKVTAMQWRLDHPPLWTLFRYAAGWPAPDAEAMRIHLEEDNCEHCRRVTSRSRAVAELRRVLESDRSARAVQEYEKAAAAMGAGADTTQPETVVAAGFSTDAREAFQVRFANADGSLITSLRETDDGRLVVEVESRDAANVGRRVLVEVLQAGDSLERELTLEGRGRFGAGADYCFGAYKEFAASLVGCSVVTSWRSGAIPG